MFKTRYLITLASFLTAFVGGALSFNYASAKEIKTNEVIVKDAPKWLTRNRMEKVTQRIQRKLEWPTRRVEMHFYKANSDFRKIHKLDANPAAFTITSPKGSSIHMGPSVTTKDFDQVYGHELVHVILYQKYKGSVPKWLEEGVANHLAGLGSVDYKWLSTHGEIENVRELSHPFKGSPSLVRYRYKASQALAEMLDKKCGLEKLIHMSLERKLEDYIVTYCEIKDLNATFKNWVNEKAKK